VRGAQRYDQADLSGSLAIVVGSEGKGMRRLVRERCDFLIQLPMRGAIPSLNASVAASVVLYEALRQRTGSSELQ
jgi:23S rRNA (guanosine2251-2'-O)-methyltransferase